MSVGVGVGVGLGVREGVFGRECGGGRRGKCVECAWKREREKQADRQTDLVGEKGVKREGERERQTDRQTDLVGGRGSVLSVGGGRERGRDR